VGKKIKWIILIIILLLAFFIFRGCDGGEEVKEGGSVEEGESGKTETPPFVEEPFIEEEEEEEIVEKISDPDAPVYEDGLLIYHIDVGSDEEDNNFEDSGELYEPTLGHNVPASNKDVFDGKTVRWIYSLGWDRVPKSEMIKSWIQYTIDDLGTSEDVRVVVQYNGLELPGARNKFYVTLNGVEYHIQDLDAPVNTWVVQEFTVSDHDGKLVINIADEEETSTASARFSDIWVYLIE